MSKFSDYLEEKIIQTTLRGQAMPVPSDIFVALFTADPTDANVTAGECSTVAWPAYVRQNAAHAEAIATGWTSPSNGVTSNAKIITFPANNGASAITVTHVGLYDASGGGNLMYHAPLVAAKTLQPGDVLSFGVGALTVTVQ
jgi:hypothetical protein